MTSDVRLDELTLSTTGSTPAAGVVHPAGPGADPGLLMLRLAIDYLQKAQATGANVSTEAVRLQQLLAGLGAV